MGLQFALRALFVCFLVFQSAKLQAEIKVACFSTVLSEIAQKVGGKNVTVTSLIKPEMGPSAGGGRPASKSKQKSRGGERNDARSPLVE
jgi:hypothetical protein